jgi:hypothetical protein
MKDRNSVLIEALREKYGAERVEVTNNSLEYSIIRIYCDSKSFELPGEFEGSHAEIGRPSEIGTGEGLYLVGIHEFDPDIEHVTVKLYNNVEKPERDTKEKTD